MDAAAATGRLRWVPLARWELWGRPTVVICYVVAVEIGAVVAAAASVVASPVSARQVSFAVVLVIAGVLYGEVMRGIELTRRHNTSKPYFDLNTVWIFAAALITHAALAAVVVMAVFTHQWLRTRHHAAHRKVFSAAVAVLSVQAAAAVTVVTLGSFVDAPRTVATFAAIVLAAVAFLLTNVALITTVIAMTTPEPTPRALFGEPSDYALEVATVALGILLAWALADWPVALVLVFGVTLALHSNVLIRQLRDHARTDPKTGLLNLATWTVAAEAELAAAVRGRSPVGLLMLDLDHFKQLNDTHGHLLGDQVLLSVAAKIAAEVRAADLVGRFGGDEFVVLLPGSGPADTQEIAERIRTRITTLRAPSGTLSVSIGAATYPDAGGSLDDLLAGADHALLAAKDRGRDQVHFIPCRAC